MTDHVHGDPDSQDELLDDLLGRGKGDPDVYGYPGESDPRWVGGKPKTELHHGDSEIEIINEDGTKEIGEIPF